MDFGHLGEVMPVAIVAFLVLLAVVVRAITMKAIRYHRSGMAGSIPVVTMAGIRPDAGRRELAGSSLRQ